MAVDVHIIITGICALLTSGGMPKDIALPADPSSAPMQHVAWLLMKKDTLADPTNSMFEQPPNDTSFRFVRLDNEKITFEPVPDDRSVARVDGVPADPENPSSDRTTKATTYWVADMYAIAAHAKMKQSVDLAALAHVPGGIFSTNLVVKDCIWNFQPPPVHALQQALAQEVDWRFSVLGDDFKIVLTKFDNSAKREIVFNKGSSQLYVFLGNTPEADIVPNGLACDPKETDDPHFALYYDLFDPLTAHPLPHKVRSSASALQLFAVESVLLPAPAQQAVPRQRRGARGAPSPPPAPTFMMVPPPRRGAGSNCPPTFVEGSLTTVQ